jgi:O-antigen/teichoic acid export membrane protein
MENVAALRALQTVVAPAFQFSTATSLLMIPWASRRFAEDGARGLQTTTRRMTAVFTAGAIAYLLFLVIFGRWMLGLFFGGKYSAYAHLLPLVALPMLTSAVALGPAIAVRAMQKPSEIFAAYSVAGAMTVLIGWGVTRYWGLVGVLVGLSLSDAITSIAIMVRYRRGLKALRQLRIAGREPLADFALLSQ